MQNVQGKSVLVNYSYSSKYIAHAQCKLPGDNNDKRPSNILEMEVGMLETTRGIKSSTQTARNVA